MTLDLEKMKKEIKTLKKKGKGKKDKDFLKKFSKKMTSKRILKKGQMTVHIPERKVESIFNDPNRFFKNEWEETKKSMFL